MGAGTSFPIVQIPKERIVIVTGANSGTGYEIAKWTAMMGATVIMACRSEHKAKNLFYDARLIGDGGRPQVLNTVNLDLSDHHKDEYNAVYKTGGILIQVAISQMNDEFRAEKAKGARGLSDAEQLSLQYMNLDLTSLKSVVDFVDELKRSGRQLHVLFCNAGVAFGPYVKTEDGFEKVLQVNYLSHFLLICKLLPIMKTSGTDCRVLLMSSDAHGMCSFDVQTINYEGSPSSYPHWEYYE